MANRRMFALSIVDTDKFLEMPPSSQSLYFALGCRVFVLVQSVLPLCAALGRMISGF